MLWKEYEDVLLEREDNVATILLNNPANMNPVTVSTMDHLFHTQIGVGNRLDGGRRRVKKYLWSFLRTAPAGQVRL